MVREFNGLRSTVNNDKKKDTHLKKKIYFIYLLLYN